MNYKFFRHVLYLLYTGTLIYGSKVDEFLEILDTTCVSLRVAAPDIQNGYVTKYDRQNINGTSFVIALYSCDDNYDFEDNTKNAMYCSKGDWIGAMPECEGHDTSYDDYEENDDIPIENDDLNEQRLPQDYDMTSFSYSEEVHQNDVIISNETQNTFILNNMASNQADVHYNESLKEQCPLNYNCDHICLVVYYKEENSNKYLCQCNTGYLLGTDGKSCIDIDECAEMNMSKKCKECKNIPGSYICIEKIENTCENHMCRNATCSPTSSVDYECICFNGYVALNKRSCRSQDCRENECPENKFCKETNNSFECVFYDPCAINNGGCSHSCTSDSTNSSNPICSCPENQIILSDSKTCGCPANTILTESQYCQYQSFCELNNGNCEQICENSLSGPFCSCFEGYNLHNLTHCKDIDECLPTNQCQQECLNTLGSFVCKCSKGYLMNYNNQCEDINECEDSAPCQYNCSNSIGSFRCHCPDGFELSEDNTTCIKLMKSCENQVSVNHGILNCIGNIESMECTVSCDNGYFLQGEKHTVCKNGEWNATFPQCRPLSCTSLPKPRFGIILPAKCQSENNLVGEKCNLHCLPGYTQPNKSVAICTSNETWSVVEDFDCLKIIDSELFIKCPQNTTIMLRKNQKDIYVRLERAKSNVNAKHIKAFPSWAQNVVVKLQSGIHKVNFRAYTDDFATFVSCNTIITVKALEPPKFGFCPRNFEVILGINQSGKSVFWKEPIFEDSSNIKNIYKSKSSGDFFVAGLHTIFYEAINNDGLKSRCEFSINVKSTSDYQKSTKQLSTLLDNHESFLICKGQLPMKISSIKVLRIPDNCLIKNVKVNPLTLNSRKRGLLREFLQHFKNI
ncbi:FBN2 family protein [Megaselia abdita]